MCKPQNKKLSQNEVIKAMNYRQINLHADNTIYFPKRHKKSHDRAFIVSKMKMRGRLVINHTMPKVGPVYGYASVPLTRPNYHKYKKNQSFYRSIIIPHAIKLYVIRVVNISDKIREHETRHDEFYSNAKIYLNQHWFEEVLGRIARKLWIMNFSENQEHFMYLATCNEIMHISIMTVTLFLSQGRGLFCKLIMKRQKLTSRNWKLRVT